MPDAPSPPEPAASPCGAPCQPSSPAPQPATGQAARAPSRRVGPPAPVQLHRWLALTWIGFPRPVELVRDVRRFLPRLVEAMETQRILDRRWRRVALRPPPRRLPGCGCWLLAKMLWERRLRTFWSPAAIPTVRTEYRPARPDEAPPATPRQIAAAAAGSTTIAGPGVAGPVGPAAAAGRPA